MVKLAVVLITVLWIHFAQPRPVDKDEELTEAITNDTLTTATEESYHVHKRLHWRTILKLKQYVWEKSGQYQGDIILPHYAPHHLRNAMYDKMRYWPNNELPYEISQSFSEADKNIILECLTYINNNTCVKPIPWRKKDRWGLYFSEKPGHGCSTLVGFWGKRQTVNLDVSIGCIQFGVILHEILHSLGLWHQQSAHNRDDYIDIKWENIIHGMEYNFDKATGDTGSFGYTYDYDSIMHYSPYAFSVNGERTLNPKSKGKGRNMGQRNGLTPTDLGKIKTMYKCK